jgi:hypothetical protein
MSGLYEPLNAYKPVAENIGVVDGPFEYLTMAGVRLPLPFTTRMTVVRLGSGELFLHSPIAYQAALAARLQALGTIRHLGARQDRAAVAVRRLADRDVLPCRPDILWHAPAAPLAETQDESGGAKNTVVAARTHHSEPRAVV